MVAVHAVAGEAADTDRGGLVTTSFILTIGQFVHAVDAAEGGTSSIMASNASCG